MTGQSSESCSGMRDIAQSYSELPCGRELGSLRREEGRDGAQQKLLKIRVCDAGCIVIRDDVGNRCIGVVGDVQLSLGWTERPWGIVETCIHPI